MLGSLAAERPQTTDRVHRGKRADPIITVHPSGDAWTDVADSTSPSRIPMCAVLHVLLYI